MVRILPLAGIGERGALSGEFRNLREEFSQHPTLGVHCFVPADEHAQIEQSLPASNSNQTRLE